MKKIIYIGIIIMSVILNLILLYNINAKDSVSSYENEIQMDTLSEEMDKVNLDVIDWELLENSVKCCLKLTNRSRYHIKHSMLLVGFSDAPNKKNETWVYSSNKYMIEADYRNLDIISNIGERIITINLPLDYIDPNKIDTNRITYKLEIFLNEVDYKNRYQTVGELKLKK